MTWSLIGTDSHISPTNSITFPTCQAGDVLITSHCSGGDNPAVDVSDSLGNTWTRLGYFHDAPNSQSSAWWAAIANGPGTPTVTFVNNGTSFVTILAAIYRTSVGTAAIDQFGDSLMVLDTDSGTDAVQSPAATASEDGALYVGFAQNTSDGTTFTPGTGFSEDVELADSTNCLSQLEHLEQSTAAALTAKWTIAASRRCIAAVATFVTGAPPPPSGDTETRRYQIRRSRMTSW